MRNKVYDLYNTSHPFTGIHVTETGFDALEQYVADVPWWDDLVEGPEKPIVQNGFIKVPDTPGLGIESLNDTVIQEHLPDSSESLWKPTDEWDSDWSHDRLWS